MAASVLPEGDDAGDIVAEINITPLTDVFLVLLIIFMVTSSVIANTGKKVDLPEAQQASSTPPKAVSDTFTIVDFYESKMSEYDSNFVFVPIAELQRMRGMIEPQTGIPSVNSIQIKLVPGADLDEVRNRLRKAFPAELYAISTWRDKQGPLLAAVEMEMAVLNILLFMIVAVAGFGILAIFFMIVVEKTRDIGILKSIGATGPDHVRVTSVTGVVTVSPGVGLDDSRSVWAATHCPLDPRTQSVAASTATITSVRMKDARSELTCSTPTLAKMAVSAANPAESSAQSCQDWPIGLTGAGAQPDSPPGSARPWAARAAPAAPTSGCVCPHGPAIGRIHLRGATIP